MKSLKQIWNEDKPKLPFYVNYKYDNYLFKNIKIINIKVDQFGFISKFTVEDKPIYDSTVSRSLFSILGLPEFNSYALHESFELVRQKKSRLPKWF